MAQRLVTKEDLEKDPSLTQKGVSINQHWDFPDEDLPKAKPPLQKVTEPAKNPTAHKSDLKKK